MNKVEIAEWLLKRIGGKVTDLTHSHVSDEMVEIVGSDIETYLGVLSDIIKEVIVP